MPEAQFVCNHGAEPLSPVVRSKMIPGQTKTFPSFDRGAFTIMGAAMVLVICALWMTGALSGKATPDTASYFVAAESRSPWGEMRHPLYGLIAGWLGGSSITTGYVALAQAILHLAAALAICLGAIAGGMGNAGALSLGLAALFSQSGLIHSRLILPESPAISFLLFAFAGVLATAYRSGYLFGLLLLPIGIASGIAYFLRPSFLPAIFVLPALWYLLALRNRQARLASKTILIVCAVALPFVIQSGLRWKSLDSFNIVSFGGFAMSAMAGFMLTPDALEKLPERIKPLAATILARREAAEMAGRIARTPLNSAGERSFVSATLGYFDLYARTYDNFLWEEIFPLRFTFASWVEFDSRLQEFSLATIAAVPTRWAAWVGGAMTRLLGRLIGTNGPMILACCLLLLVGICAFARRTAAGPSAMDVPVVLATALGWLFCTAPLIALVTFPATRYIDTAGILLPAVPVLAAVCLIEGLCAKRPPRPNEDANGHSK